MRLYFQSAWHMVNNQHISIISLITATENATMGGPSACSLKKGLYSAAGG